MLAAKILREQSDRVRQSLQDRHSSIELYEKWLSLDIDYREVLGEVEKLKATRNQFKPQGKPTPEQLSEMKELSDRIKTLEATASEKEQEVTALSLVFPNLLSADTPVGKDSAQNPVVKTWGTIPTFSFEPKPHDELGKQLGILDFARGAKLAGSRFTVYKGLAAKLERSLINFMLDIHTGSGWEEVLTPFLVNAESMTGTGQLPKFEEELYKCERDGLYLIPTAEVPVTNIYRDEILDEAQIPMKMCAYTPCFRREAGSYGKDITGLIRQHQFNKVELVMYAKPDDSDSRLEELTQEAERILEILELPYRRVRLCSGDVGFSSGKTYDLEVWFPATGQYREISSCSNFYDFQARRAKIRYRRESDQSVDFIHTLNGSGLAVGRTLAALFENYQTAEGRVRIPDALRDYMKVDLI